VTFLFTDIEGSTVGGRQTRNRCARRCWPRRGSALAIESHEGFCSAHTGDGVVARSLPEGCGRRGGLPPSGQLELPVRMGIATGEAELRDGDYFGTVLNRAARVMAAGTAVRFWWRTRRLSGERVDLVSLGSRRLRDLRT